MNILIVDDQQAIAKGTRIFLRSKGFKDVSIETDSRNVMGHLERKQPDVILLDLLMPHISGEELLPKIKEKYPDVVVFVITAIDKAEKALSCIRKGAEDYFVKPLNLELLVNKIKLAKLGANNSDARRTEISSSRENIFEDIVTEHASMHELFEYIKLISVSRRPVLITGETGTGKDLFAKAVCALSPYNKPMLSVNAAELDEAAFSDVLFGAKEDGYGGQSKPGVLDDANGSCLFLDEIGDLGPHSQITLLRLLEENTYYPAGSTTAKQADTKIILSTHVDLDRWMESGKLRKDLFYRMQFHRIHIPPLRERKRDIPLLLDYFIKKFAKELNVLEPMVQKEAVKILMKYSFKGNVRELGGLVYDALLKSQSSSIEFESCLMDYMQTKKIEQASVNGERAEWHDLIRADEQFPTLKEANEVLIELALKSNQYNQSRAAKLLGISRQALNKRLKQRVEQRK